MTDDPTGRNRLDEAASPYLRQHADNPVHWQPWDETALRRARERDVPLFVSIGYSSCHWCHVMEEESFRDDDVAELLNEHFVPVKVDREERPDVDDVYMTVCQAVRGGGGWPLSVFALPTGEPFYVATYLPPEPKRGQPGFRQVLEDVAETWRTDRDELADRAEQWAALANDELAGTPDPGDPPGAEALRAAADAAVDRADRQHGGFGTGQKFPQPRRVDALLRAWDRTGDDEYRAVAVETLDAMATGGLRDHLGGGFHRYCTDREWVVPHFEKMLYDNADLARLYVDAHRATGDERYADVARETLAFVDRELGEPDGGFRGTLDARSAPHWDGATADAVEGAFYTWTPEEVRAAVDDEALADLACERFGVTETGDVEGRSVLTLHADPDVDPDAVDRARSAMRAARAERSRPARDDKVIGAWNGLAASAFAEAGLALDPSYADRAVEALAFVRDTLWDGDRLARRSVDGDVAGDGYLSDYAFLARAALDAHAATGDHAHLDFALELARRVRDLFYDADAGTLYFTPADGEELVARPQELRDGATPSPAGVAAETLLALDHVAPDEEFGAVAETVLGTHAATVEDDPFQHPSLAVAADALASGHLELTVVADAVPADWRADLGGRYLPDRLLTRRPPTAGALDELCADLGLAAAPPAWDGRDAAGEAPTLYVCRRACSPPLADADEAAEWIDRLRP